MISCICVMYIYLNFKEFPKDGEWNSHNDGDDPNDDDDCTSPTLRDALHTIKGSRERENDTQILR